MEAKASDVSFRSLMRIRMCNNQLGKFLIAYQYDLLKYAYFNIKISKLNTTDMALYWKLDLKNMT